MSGSGKRIGDENRGEKRATEPGVNKCEGSVDAGSSGGVGASSTTGRRVLQIQLRDDLAG
jgi:hypothetical protein